MNSTKPSLETEDSMEEVGFEPLLNYLCYFKSALTNITNHF